MLELRGLSGVEEPRMDGSSTGVELSMRFGEMAEETVDKAGEGQVP